MYILWMDENGATQTCGSNYHFRWQHWSEIFLESQGKWERETYSTGLESRARNTNNFGSQNQPRGPLLGKTDFCVTALWNPAQQNLPLGDTMWRKRTPSRLRRNARRQEPFFWNARSLLGTTRKGLKLQQVASKWQDPNCMKMLEAHG